MKMLHWFNCSLYMLNAVMWATIAHMPVAAFLWGSVAVAELFIIKKIIADE